MLTHPHTLKLLTEWKLSKELVISKDLLVLIIYTNNKIQISELHDILFKYKKNKQKREINMEILKISLEKWFYLEKGAYFPKDLEDILKPTLKLISKNTFSHPKVDYIKNLHDNITDLEIFNPDLTSKVIYKLIPQLIESDINIKKFVGNIENLLKDAYQKFVPKKIFNGRDSLADSSMLNFISKREKIEVQSTSKFDPIQFDNSVYVYNLRNPNFETFRKRRDLVNPVKKIFIKFGDESRPPIYKIQTQQVFIRNSLKKLLNVDYEEDSTWGDEDEGEDINSEESEKEEEASGDEEWVDEDSYEQNINKTVKRPILIFPKIKCIKNEEDTDFWSKLPLEKNDTISEDLKGIIVDYKKRDYSLQQLSNIFMINENILEKFLEAN